MSGDYTWDDMPEELALELYDLSQGTLSKNADTKAIALQEWLGENIKKCAAESQPAIRLPEMRCRELPVPGSEFCPLHMSAEERGDNDG